MTNYEFYKDEIIGLVVNGRKLAVQDDKPIACKDTSCCVCDIYVRSPGSCKDLLKKWLNAEHVEKPKLTKKERMFCELVETGWIARDFGGKLYHYACEPSKGGRDWFNGNFDLWIPENVLHDCTFSFITWGDEEPWSVEELLKLEVMEG